MDAINFRALRGLIQNLPISVVLFENRSQAAMANDRFAEVFLPGQLDHPDLRRMARTPGGTWQPVTLRRRDGRDLVVGAKAVASPDGVLLVFDTGVGPNLMSETERLRGRIAELESLSATDPLTGAWNRTQLERTVDVEISRANRSGQPVTLVWLDIDHFKRVNDDHGHLTGDAVLKEFVVRIRKRLRNTDSLFRWGGDEFVVVAASAGYRGGAALAEGLRRTIAAVPFGEAGSITVSAGVAGYVAGESARRWFERADLALYAAKSAGRSRVHVDREGSSALHPNRPGEDARRLYWMDAYECGDPTIDGEHRELFDRGNALIAAATERDAEPALWRAALDSMLAQIGQHFQAEEALMAWHGYPRLAAHRRAHAGLLTQVGELSAAVERGEATPGRLVNFIVNDAIALHLLKVDRDFDLLLQRENGGRADPPSLHGDVPILRRH